MNPLPSGTIVSIQVGRPESYGQPGATDPHDQPWTTGFFKESVAMPVWVGRLNIEGDGQADLENHGGLDKAVLAYSADHYHDWQHELRIPDLRHGAFGENLTVGGLTEHDVCIGDTWQAGDVLLQVSQPRQPCWKLGRRWRRSDLPKRVVQTGRSGWYLRVLEEGTLTPGDEFVLAERPHPDWPIRRANQVMYNKDDDDNKRKLAEVAALSAAWQRMLTGHSAKDEG